MSQNKNIPKRGQHIQVTTQEAYIGPIPPPDVLQGFDHVSPGLAKQITDDAFANSAHKRKMEADAMEATIHESKANVFFAYFITSIFGMLAISLLAGGMYLIVHGRSPEGWVALGLVIFPVAKSYFQKKPLK